MTPGSSTGACVWAPPQLYVFLQTRSFGLIARHIRAYRQDARAHPVLPDEQRSQGNVARTNQVSMKGILATPTHKSESFVGTVRSAGVAAHRASEAAVVGIHLHGHTARKQSFIGDGAVQFSESPLRSVPIALALFAGDWLMPFPVLLALVGTPPGAFANVCQVFQADDAVWVRLHNAATDEVIAFLFQPSLSSTDHHQTAGSGTSAFLLQALSQSRIMISCGP